MSVSTSKTSLGLARPGTQSAPRFDCFLGILQIQERCIVMACGRGLYIAHSPCATGPTPADSLPSFLDVYMYSHNCVVSPPGSLQHPPCDGDVASCTVHAPLSLGNGTKAFVGQPLWFGIFVTNPYYMPFDNTRLSLTVNCFAHLYL